MRGTTGQSFTNPNEAYGVSGSTIYISALGTGTFPAAGWTYNFFVNGSSIGVLNSIAGGTTATIPWTPPQPGTYSITVQATGIGNSVNSLPVRYFATGTAITSPVNGSIVPNGSSVVIEATATPQPLGNGQNAFVQRIDFFADGSATAFASDSTAPYSAIYTPTTTGSHTIEAKAYDNLGQQISANGTATRSMTVVTATGSVPTSVISSPQNNSTVAVPTSDLTVSVDANSPSGRITRVELYVDGVLFGTDTSFPYSFAWLPSVVGSYRLVALTYDDVGNVVASSTNTVRVAAPPTVAITTPNANGTVSGGTPTQLAATATTSTSGATISSVQFFVDSVFVGQATTASSGNTYSVSATLTQKKDDAGTVLTSVVTALAVDSNGLTTTSASVSVNVTAGGGGAPVVIGNPPTVSVTSPTASSTVGVNSPVFVAANASDSDGNITKVEFFANSVSVGSDTAYPYNTTWTPTNLGSYAITAQATDDKGNAVTSSAVTVTVADNSPSAPSVAITSPAHGSSVSVNSTRTVVATATDDVAIASVQFFVNGQPMAPAGGAAAAPDTTFPYQAEWSPGSPGVYTLTARAIDTVGNVTTSAATVVIAIDSTAATSASVFTGNYSGISGTTIETGRFALVTVGTTTATFMAYSTSSPGKSYFYSGGTVDSSGGVSFGATATVGSVTGSAFGSGISGTFDGSRLTFIGQLGFASNTAVASGYYQGSLNGNNSSRLAGIVSPDGTIFVYANDGSTSDVGSGTVNSAGAFTARHTLADNSTLSTFTGTVNPTTGLMSGAMTGAVSGDFRAALATGGANSDGLLFGLSTRGYVGTGADVMVAGFVVNGSVNKRIGIRGKGPSMAAQGVSGTLANPKVDLYRGSTLIATNDDWAVNSAALSAAGLAAPTSAAESALVATLAPGSYTAQLTGVNGGTGVGLIEIYDTDSVSAFSSQKVTAIATRGFVNSGDGLMIAGFVISGSSPKKVLIEAVGPTLGGGFVGDPVLRLVSSSGATVRENDNWEVGNDSKLVIEAAARSGATPLAAGGKDAAILISLPPGTYTAVVSGSGGSTGLALLNVYEVP